MTEGQRCQATTTSGERCSLPALEGSRFCGVHAHYYEREAADPRIGGILAERAARAKRVKHPALLPACCPRCGGHFIYRSIGLEPTCGACGWCDLTGDVRSHTITVPHKLM